MISPPSSYMRLFIIILKDSKASIHSTFVEGGVLVEIVLNDRQEMHARQSETNASSSTVFCQNKCNLRNLYKQAIPALTALHWFPSSYQDVKLAWTTSFLFLPRRSILHLFFFRIAGSIIHQNYGHIQGLSATNDWYVSTKLCICHAR